MKKIFLEIKNKFFKDKGKYENLLSQISEKEKEVNTLYHKQEILDKARVLLLKTGEYQRSTVKKDIEDMVTKALQYIREEEIFFEIQLKESRGRSECEFLVKTIRDGVVTTTGITESRGDGISDIVSLALDIAMIELSGIKGPIILDEPAKQVSKVYVENVGNLLKDLSDAFDRQIIMITHNKDLMNIGDKKLEVVLEGSVSKVIEY